MRAFIFIFSFICANFITNELLAQKNFAEVCRAHQVDTNYIKLIDKDKLRRIVELNKTELNLVCIFTNLCSGTHYMLKNIDSLEKEFQSRLGVILCNSNPYKEMPDYLKQIKDYHIQTKPVYIIDSRKYKDKKSDARVKGFKFRNDICEECKDIIIGVPFFILFSQNGEILQKGYPSTFEYKQFIRSYYNADIKK